MVKYYGRARQRIGSVNTNQIGLKMSGCPSKVGRKGTIDRYISRRSQCNQKYCGPVYYHGVIWNFNQGACVAKAPRGQSFNSGVGTKVGNPRFACNKTCSTNLDPLTAVKILQGYFRSLGLDLILVGKKETLNTDGVDHPDKFEPIQHFYPGTQEYAALPVIIRNAVDVINGLELEGPLKLGGKPVVHVVGAGTKISLNELYVLGYGHKKVKFGPDVFVRMFQKDKESLITEWSQCNGMNIASATSLVACVAATAIANSVDLEVLEPASVVVCIGMLVLVGVDVTCLLLTFSDWASQ